MWQRGPSGLIVRRSSTGIHSQGNNRGTAPGPARPSRAKSAARLYLASLSAQWNELTPLQQDLWAAWGDTPTGRSSYLSVNMWRLINLVARTDSPPAPTVAPTHLRSLSAVLVGIDLRVAFAPAPLTGGRQLHIRMGQPITGAKTPRLERSAHSNLSQVNAGSTASMSISHIAQLGQRQPVWVAVVHVPSHTIGEYRLLTPIAT